MGQCQDGRHTFLSCLADAHSPHGNVVATFPLVKPTREEQASAPWHSQPSPLPALLRLPGDLAAYRTIQEGDQSRLTSAMHFLLSERSKNAKRH
eukprot:8552882-Pyramimonas_sp.AAC.1